MNLGIIIGVSEYDNLKELSACKNDANIVRTLLSDVKKYDNILYLDNNTYAQNIKNEIIDFINKYKDEDIEEIFFYFSGHGWFGKDEFHYICTDYDSSKISTTTLKNSELDSIIKIVSPKLAVKVVDACNSGIKYIKGEEDLIQLKSKMQAEYTNCYFMFSSQQEESSYATDKISYFTESFIKSIVNFKYDKIRYRDIMDYISDEFSMKNINQRPFYVTQCNNTEYFAVLNNEMQMKINDILKSILNKENQEDDNKEAKDIYQIVLEESMKYCNNLSEINSVLELINESFNEEFIDKEFNKIYDVEVISDKIQYDEINNIKEVAENFEDNTNGFFVALNYKKVKVKEKVRKRGLLINSWFSEENNYEYVDTVKNVVSSYNITVQDINYNSIIIEIKSKFHNVNSIKCNMIFAFSRRYINIFYFIEPYIETNWNEYKIREYVDWNKVEFEIKDSEALKDNINKIKNSINNYLSEYILNKYNLNE